MVWTNVVVEGYCFGKEKDGKYPCGHNCPSSFCLKNKMCPHFAWCDSSERDAAVFVPLRKIMWDRLSSWREDIYWKVRWFFWDQLPFNQRKVNTFLKNIPVLTAENDTTGFISKMEEADRKNQEEFEEWIGEATKDA